MSYLGSVTELIARWIVQNLLEPTILFSQSSCSEDVSASPEPDSNCPIEQAPGADKLSIGSSEELVVTRGTSLTSFFLLFTTYQITFFVQSSFKTLPSSFLTAR